MNPRMIVNNLVNILIVWLLGLALVAASSSLASAQVVPPGPPVTIPQVTVPCDPTTACTRGGAPPVSFVWADLVRFCNGSAVPVTPGHTAYGLIYGNGSLSTESATFVGTVQKNGVEIPSVPLTTLSPGERDVRLREGVVDNGDVITITLTATGPSGNQLTFGNGATIKRLTASGACPDAVPAPLITPTLIPPATVAQPQDAPVVITTVPEGEFPPTL